MIVKRTFDVLISGLALIALSPFFAVVAVIIAADSRGGIFFRQTRVGRHSKPFKIFKFRTMQPASEQAGQLTIGNDGRVTKIGKFLRKSKVDELPQLINVFVGEMSFVGPRPEVPKFMEHVPTAARERILSVRPGITDNASILFRDESELLGTYEDPEKAYIEIVLPRKVAMYVEYAEGHSFLGDFAIIFQTLFALFLRPKPPLPSVKG